MPNELVSYLVTAIQLIAPAIVLPLGMWLWSFVLTKMVKDRATREHSRWEYREIRRRR